MITVSIFNTSCQKQTDYSPQIDSLQASLLSLQKRCDSLAIALNKANLNLQTTNTNVDNQTKLIATIQTQVVSILSQIVTLTSQLNSTNADVTTINSKITDLNSQLNSLLLQMNKLLAQQAVINSLQASLTKLQNRCDSVVNALVVTNSNLQTTNKALTSLQNQVITISGQIVKLNSQLDSTDVNVTYILSQITNLNDQYTSLTTQINLILIKLGMLPSSLKSGLVAWYPFSGNANDESGNNHNGTVNGAKLTTDRFGNANSSYNFSGTTNDITLANSQNLVNGSFTVSAWCTIDILAPYNSDAVIIGQFNGEIANDRKWLFGYRSFNSERGISYYLFDNSGNSTFLPYPWTLNWNPQISTWYHIVWVFTSGNSIKTYVNGVLHSNVSITLSKYNNTVNNVLTKIGNGLDYGNSAPLPWNGKIDDIGIWNRALTQQEVSLLTGTN